MEAIKVLSSNKFYTAEMKQNRFYIQLLLSVLGNFVGGGGGGFVLHFLNSYINHYKTVFLLVIIFITRKYFTTEMQPR